MASSVSQLFRAKAPAKTSATTESPWVRASLIGIALLFLASFLLIPLVEVFVLAFRGGIKVYWNALTDPETWSAIRLTLITAAIAVPLNLLFGLTASWALTKFEFRGKNFLITLIDLPFSVSPVISGMIFVLLFGSQGVFRAILNYLLNWLQGTPGLSQAWVDSLTRALVWLTELKIIFTPIGIVLATLFVTFPFVARELIPLMQAQGREEEEAAMTLGAGGFRTFLKITLPNIKWGLLYGVILCNARAMGEFGAVSVVSGHIRGLTNTMPLQVEILYNDSKIPAAFAVASLLALLALVTLIAKGVVEWRARRAGMIA